MMEIEVDVYLATGRKIDRINAVFIQSVSNEFIVWDSVREITHSSHNYCQKYSVSNLIYFISLVYRGFYPPNMDKKLGTLPLSSP